MDEIHRCFFLRIRGEGGNSPRAVLERGKQWFGLAMVVLSSNRQLSVRAIHGGSLVVFRVNTGSAHLGKASSTGVRARGVVVGRGVSDTSARERRWGKTVMRAPRGGGFFYRSRSPGAGGEMSRC
jgi:hypothetical protein